MAEAQGHPADIPPEVRAELEATKKLVPAGPSSGDAEAQAKAKEQSRLDLINATIQRNSQAKSAYCPTDMTPQTYAGKK